MKLLLIRHGQSANNALSGANHPVSSQYPDPTLTDLGRQQAETLAHAFTDGLLPRPSVLLSSPMTRAVQTAAPLADEPTCRSSWRRRPTRWVASSRACRAVLGSFQGASRAELADISDRLIFNEDIHDEGWYRLGSHVETPAEGQGRGKRLYRSILERYGNQDGVVALVCHEWITNYVLRAALGLSDPEGGSRSVVLTAEHLEHLHPDRPSVARPL